MKYIDEFRNRRLIDKLSKKIDKIIDRSRIYNIMDVCGTHTMNIFRFGLKDILPKNINLISGPGCPVCVTPNSFLDMAIRLSNLKNVIITTFGDMFRVPGSYSTLEKEKAKGNSIRVIHSSLDALDIARKNTGRDTVFLGIGFETTAPTVAQSILIAKRAGIRNYSVLCGHKTMPRILNVLAKEEDANIDGLILPGHVSAIIGSQPYEFLSKQYGIRCVIAGFEPLDILQALIMLITQRTPKVEIQYKRVITRNGNTLAQDSIRKVFKKSDSAWRGMGLVKDSGLRIRDEYSRFDAKVKFKLKSEPSREDKNCICGDVLKGIKRPLDCRLFGKRCKPDNPVGACMVSSEGTCAAYYRYRG